MEPVNYLYLITIHCKRFAGMPIRGFIHESRELIDTPEKFDGVLLHLATEKGLPGGEWVVGSISLLNPPTVDVDALAKAVVDETQRRKAERRRNKQPAHSRQRIEPLATLLSDWRDGRKHAEDVVAELFMHYIPNPARRD